MSVLVLVPSPLRARRAARRLCDAGDGMLFGARVSTADAFAQAVLAASGEGSTLLSPLGERLLALRVGEAVFGPSLMRPDGGAARALSRTLAELRQGEVQPEAVRAAARTADAGGHLASVAEALERYAGELARHRALDRPAAARAAVDALERGAGGEALRGLDLLAADGWVAPPPATRDLLLAVARRLPRAHVRVPFLPERAELCGPAEPFLRACEALGATASGLSIALDADGRRGRLGALLRTFGRRGAAPAAQPGPGPGDEAGGDVVALAAAGPTAEAEEAAAAVAGLLGRGFAAADVLLFATAPDAVAPALQAALAAHGVALATGAVGSLAASSPVQFALAALRAGPRPGRAAVEALLASPYLATVEAGELPALLDRAGALDGRGDPEAALRRRAAALAGGAAARERGGLLRAADAVAWLAALLAPLAAPGTPAEHAARLRGFLAATGARRRAARGPLDLARRDLAALGALEEAADALGGALAALGGAGERLAASRWAELLELALASAPAADGGPELAGDVVELWPVSEAPGLGARAAVVVGCAEGRFPAGPARDPFLRDADRAALAREAGFGAIATAPAQRARAAHAALCALAAAREALVVTWAGDGPEGPGDAPSTLLAEALAEVDVPVAPRAARAELAAAEALRALGRAGRDGAPAPVRGREADPALGARAASVLARGAQESERLAAVRAARAAPAAGELPGALASALAEALPAEWSPSSLEEHARCPFRLFARLVLRLAEPEPAGLDLPSREEGSLAHAILERFFRERRDAGAGPLRGDPAELASLQGAAEAVFALFEAKGRAGDPATWPGRRAAVLAKLARVVKAEAAREDAAVPLLVEHAFGAGAAAPALAFPDPDAPGGEVRLRGRVDRVDATPARLTIVDYKDARSKGDLADKLDPEAMGATSFQLPAYLLAAARALPGRTRLEATYLLLRSAERLDPLVLEGEDPTAALEGFGPAVVARVRAIRAGRFPIAPSDCGGCPFGAVCRFEGLSEER